MELNKDNSATGWFIEDGTLHLLAYDYRDGSVQEVLKVPLWNEGGEMLIDTDEAIIE